MAPADVPEVASILIHGSSSKRSRTPQVNAPCEPPPCKARSKDPPALRCRCVVDRRAHPANSAMDMKPSSTTERVLVDLTVLHDDLEVFGGVGDQVNILQRIAVDQQEIGKRALFHDAELARIWTAFAG